MPRVAFAVDGAPPGAAVCGSLPELGAWDPARALALTPDVGGRQSASAEVAALPGDASFKLVCGGEWEAGANRALGAANHVEWRAEPDFAAAEDGTRVVAGDPWLAPHADALRARFAAFEAARARILATGAASLADFARGYERFGVRPSAADAALATVAEWAPGAAAVSVVGDFNGWDRAAHPLARDEFGVWSGQVPRPAHQSRYKLALTLADGSEVHRLPTWAPYVVQAADSVSFSAVFWDPPQPHEWRHGPRRGAPADDQPLRIYEAHVGMSGEEPRVASYREFADNVLPRVAALNYNCVQLMAVMEHAYYASFGYHVTNFFAASSRCGTPDELKRLVDRAHELGLRVIMDVVHSHASKNVDDGINLFDGSDHQYFHAGAKGEHPLWDSRCFNYGHLEVQRFLLSNLRWWADEYRFDGFRFDGVTSMLYHHHGAGVGFSGAYHEYFGPEVDQEAVVYAMLANALLHEELEPPLVTVAEDVSGMPTLCCPVADGGVGFDYRLAMAVPDMWIKLLKEVPDDEWDMGALAHTLQNRRHTERAIVYSASHDQSLVGDKTLAMWLMDAEMYTGMSVLQPPSPVVDRGVALLKVIALLTSALGGEGYLNFMGNEFGHPEWIDFPREGNGNSFHHCRRQWHLCDDPLLRYQHLAKFDAAMNALEQAHGWLRFGEHAFVSLKHEGDKLIVFEKVGLLFVFNLHPTGSFADYRVGLSQPGKYAVALTSDDPQFGGHGRVDASVEYFTEPVEQHGRPCSMLVYAPSRTVTVYEKTG